MTYDLIACTGAPIYGKTNLSLADAQHYQRLFDGSTIRQHTEPLPLSAPLSAFLRPLINPTRLISSNN